MLDKSFFLCYNTKEILKVVSRTEETTHMNKGSRILIFLFAAIFTVAVISSSIFSGYEASHDCVGGECTVCAVLDSCRDFLGKTGEGAKAVTKTLFAVFAIIFSIFVYTIATVKKSPVNLKVKLIN